MLKSLFGEEERARRKDFGRQQMRLNVYNHMQCFRVFTSLSVGASVRASMSVVSDSFRIVRIMCWLEHQRLMNRAVLVTTKMQKRVGQAITPCLEEGIAYDAIPIAAGNVHVEGFKLIPSERSTSTTPSWLINRRAAESQTHAPQGKENRQR
jgi:hypothetical protein